MLKIHEQYVNKQNPLISFPLLILIYIHLHNKLWLAKDHTVHIILFTHAMVEAPITAVCSLSFRVLSQYE